MAITRADAPILLATYGSPGDLQPFLAIGLELEQRGQPVTIATSEAYRERVTHLGLRFAPVRPDREPAQPDPDFLERVRRGERPARLFREMFMPGLRDSTVDLIAASDGARAVVSHTLVSGGRLAAEVRNLPWISTVMQPMGYLSAAEPPVIGPGFIAGMLRMIGVPGTRVFLREARRISAPWAREWHDLRRELRLPVSDHHPLFEGQHSHLLSLGIFPRVLGEPQSDWPTAARVSGFPFLRDPARQLPPALAEFLATGEPPIVFTLGTTAVNDPGRFYEESASAVRSLGVRAVLVTGPDSGGPRGDDQMLGVPWAPHDLLFPQSSAVVHQGGIGTLAEAMAAGKPMVIMPYAHDQADNAWRARRLGVAEVLPRRRYNEQNLGRVLTRLLESRRRAERCRSVCCAVAREHGASAAAQYILRSLEGTVRTVWPARSATM